MEGDFEEQLAEAGKVLLNPINSTNQLLNQLDLVGKLLGKVEQSPSQSMLKALSPTIEAVVKEPLLRSENEDVRVAVASCMSEITRITAPDAPYDDNQMKEVFQLIVSSFENLSDNSSPSYSKRISILETVAKVRSCVVMLDLECEGLIVEMFQHFLKAIRDHHPDNVFASMEIIMTLVLEESEDIGLELISPMLANLKKDNLDVQPIARKLAEKVIGTCATKVKPCLLDAKSSMNFSFDDYSTIVSEICKGADLVGKDNHKSSGEQLTNELADGASSGRAVQVQETKESEAETPDGQVHHAPEETSPDVELSAPVESGREDDCPVLLGTGPGKDHPSSMESSHGEEHPVPVESGPGEDHPDPAPSSRSATSNGVTETEIEDVSKGQCSSERAEQTNEEDRSHDDANVEGKAELGDSVSENIAKAEPRSAQVTGKRSKKTKRPMKSTLSTGFTYADTNTVKEAKGPTDADIILDKKAHASPTRAPSPEVAKVEPKSAQVTKKRSKTPKRPIKSTIHAESSHTDTDTEKEANKKVHASPTRDPSTDVAVHTDDTETEQLSSPKALESQRGNVLDEGRSRKDRRFKKNKELSEKTSPPEDVASEIATEGTSQSKVKLRGRSGKKAFASDSPAEKAQVPVKTSQVEGGSESDSDVKVAKKSSRKVQTRDHISSKKEAVTSAKPSKVAKDDSPLKGTPKTSSKRKTTPSQEKALDAKNYGKDLVGAKIKVWWPMDKMFYEGVVESFNSKNKKHKVVYADGEIEDLNLGVERWEQIEDDDSMGDGDRETSDGSPETSPAIQKRKKAKISVESSAKKGKTQGLRDGEASSSRSKGTSLGRKEENPMKVSPKSSAKFDDVGGKSKDRTKRHGGKSSVEASEKAGKSKDDDSGTLRRSVKFNLGSSKTVTKDTAKAATKDSPKTVTRDSPRTAVKDSTKTGSKSNSPKRGNKPSASSPGKAKSGSLKSKETKEKEKSPEVVKAVMSGKRKSAETTTKGKESEGKSGKKRMRS